jgi:DNA-binding GntR family transcriptional regulator
MSPSRPQSDALRLVIGPALSDRAYTALREAITDGRYLPGARLTERALAANLGISPTPAHEALRRLEYERLIERDAVRTIRVADPSTSQLYDLTLIEAALRGVAARLAARNAHLVDMIATAAAFDAAFRIKRSARSQITASGLRSSLDKHRAVALAIQRRDAATADQVMREHILERAAPPAGS